MRGASVFASYPLLGGLLLLAACASKPEPVAMPAMPAPSNAQSLGAMQPVPPPAPAMTLPEPVQPKMAMSGPGFGAHMASYNNTAAAERGYTALALKYPAVKELKKILKAFDPPTGGATMTRLVVGEFPTSGDAFRFCDWAKRQNLYCGVMPLIDNAPLLQPEKPKK